MLRIYYSHLAERVIVTFGWVNSFPIQRATLSLNDYTECAYKISGSTALWLKALNSIFSISLRGTVS